MWILLLLLLLLLFGTTFTSLECGSRDSKERSWSRLSFRNVEIRFGIGPLDTSRLWLCGVEGMDVAVCFDVDAGIGAVI